MSSKLKFSVVAAAARCGSGVHPLATPLHDSLTVKITLLSEESIRLEGTAGPLTIEAESAEQQYSPFHMLASSLAVCTHSVLYSWADHVGFGADDLVIEVAWTFAETPHRVGTMNLTYRWPSLPPERKQAAKRAAALCTVHATLTHSPVIAIEEST